MLQFSVLDCVFNWWSNALLLFILKHFDPISTVCFALDKCSAFIFTYLTVNIFLMFKMFPSIALQNIVIECKLLKIVRLLM